MPAYYELHVLYCRKHTLFVTDCCTLWGTYLVCHGLLHIVGYIPCLSQTVAHCGVHTLFVTDCCTLWGTYLVMDCCTLWGTYLVMDCCTLWGTYLVCHGLLHIVGYIPCLSRTVAHCGVHTLFVMDCCTLWGMNEWMNENLYMAHKKLPHKTLRVHSARYTQCIHVSSRKLKLPKDMHSYPPTPFQKWNYA